MPTENQQQICEQLDGCGLRYRLTSADSLSKAENETIDKLGVHAVFDVIEVDLEAGWPVTIETIKEFVKLKKLKINGIDPIANGYEPIFGFLELESVSFERSGLEDLSGFSKLVNLERFEFWDLTHHQTGAEVLGALPRLVILKLDESTVTQKELFGISKSKSIVDLSFAVADDSFDLSSIAAMKQLKYLGIYRPKVSDVDLNPLLELPNLKRVRIRHPLDRDAGVIWKLEERGAVVDA